MVAGSIDSSSLYSNPIRFWLWSSPILPLALAETPPAEASSAILAKQDRDNTTNCDENNDRIG
jgi:hypothetical protein